LLSGFFSFLWSVPFFFFFILQSATWLSFVFPFFLAVEDFLRVTLLTRSSFHFFECERSAPLFPCVKNLVADYSLFFFSFDSIFPRRGGFGSTSAEPVTFLFFFPSPPWHSGGRLPTCLFLHTKIASSISPLFVFFRPRH